MSSPEVLHGDGETVQDLGVDALVLEVDEIHLLPDLLERGLGAQGSEVGADVAVSLGGDLEGMRTCGVVTHVRFNSKAGNIYERRVVAC